MADASLLSAASQSHQVKLKAPRDVAWRSTLLGYETTPYDLRRGHRDAGKISGKEQLREARLNLRFAIPFVL